MTENNKLLKISEDPFALFNQWFKEAEHSEINDPNAMNLSTVSEDFKPSSRMVLLKSFNNQGFVFYTNTNSKKGLSIKKNPNVALNFHWKSLLKQIRIEGLIKQVSNDEADKYFDSRNKGSKIGAWASKQSSELTKRKNLEENIFYFKEKFFNKKISRPPYWSGFRVKPNLFEFWQDMPFRLHDRLEFKIKNDQWIVKKLFP